MFVDINTRFLVIRISFQGLSSKEDVSSHSRIIELNQHRSALSVFAIMIHVFGISRIEMCVAYIRPRAICIGR